VKAFFVSEYEIWAANDADEARSDYLDETGCEADEDIFRELSTEEYDEPFDETDEDEKPTGEKTTIRAELANLTKPGFVAAVGCP
jgi:hypothetical protein